MYRQVNHSEGHPRNQILVHDRLGELALRRHPVLGIHGFGSGFSGSRRREAAIVTLDEIDDGDLGVANAIRVETTR